MATLPPGPKGLPIIGASYKWKGPETNLAWAQEFGPLYSVRMGPNLMVYLNSIELVEEYMERKGDAFLGRPEGPATIANGLVFGQGERWKENRAAMTCAMKTGPSHATYEDIIGTEADRVLQQMKSACAEPLHLGDFFLPALTSRLATLLLGEALDCDSEVMIILLEQMRNLEEVDLTSKWTQMFLKVRHFRRPLEAISGCTIPDMFKMSEAMQAIIRQWISTRREALRKADGKPDSNALLDHILVSEQYSSRPENDDKELVQSLMDLFFGGVTSSLSAIEFFCLYLIHYPEVQNKVKDELRRALSSNVTISWANQQHFPYTRATLTEVLRLGSVTPSSLPHVATEDAIIEDKYEVPKGAFVLASIFSLHRDPHFYKDPELFNPQRHLDDNGKFVKPKSYRPFGIGKRNCVGGHLAEIELFLFITKLLSQFRIRAVDPASPPPFECHMRITRRIKPFTCVLEPDDTP
ncbi:hypothetical protein C0Q70_12530 [Pomacea canaliculata]|uniref:Cytochrome P450 n=1 Tax=Pomacea canaliculata TaxID=400727 RepID=A0A2T7P1S3_POMCA|nr:farnesoate epoxidase-like [Pomacea canaliculata]PVD27372.1 hypothetical protein C0Q70_12530 [Pomacea canaliculata]